MKEPNDAPPVLPLDTRFPGVTMARLEKASAALSASLRSLKAIDDQLGDPAATLRSVRQARKQLENADVLRVDLEALEAFLTGECERQFLELESTIRSTCAVHGWRLDGQWPQFYIERGVPLAIDESNRAVVVSGSRLSGASAEEIVAALEPLIRGLVPRDFAADIFMRDLAAAYDEVRHDSAQVALFAVYKCFVINAQGVRFWRDAAESDFCGVSADQFRARLTASLAAGATAAPDGREIRLFPPLNTKDGLFVYQPAEARFGFVGRIQFSASSHMEGV